MKFYRLVSDMKKKGQWMLDAPKLIGAPLGTITDWRLIGGEIISPLPVLEVEVAQKGFQTDISFALFDIPVVNAKVLQAIEKMGWKSIQPIPIAVKFVDGEFFVLNAVKKLSNCIIEEKSLIEKWTEQDGRPDLLGKYRTVGRIVLDVNKVRGADTFRPEEWNVALIVSDEFKQFVDSYRFTGVSFEPIECN
jgi:hypothetical protein